MDKANDAPAPSAWRKLLDISTVHLCTSTRERMEQWTPEDAPVSGFASHYYGWFMWVPTEPDDFAHLGIPPDLRECLEWARKHGAEYVLFDADGPDHDALTRYEEGEMPAGYADWLEAKARAEADDAEASEDRRLEALEVAYLDGEVSRSAFLNGGA